ncbi:fructosamine kinase family protein [Janibacter anophelis]|uniref:fructosamine kinase family protein n=1 Tax=Janibacter anophelis TaxID=319054 RepID=UPI003F7D09A4
MKPPRTYRKDTSAAPRGYSSWEAAGLLWLAEAQDGGGAQVAELQDVDLDHLDLLQYDPAPSTNVQADALGVALAATHAAGAPGFGAPPARWTSHGFIGPAESPLPMPLEPSDSWGAFYAEQRIRHLLRIGRANDMWEAEQELFERVAQRLESGEFDDGRPPARVHGDLWAGNILWTRSGAVLIDPAAHGGHAETDLAMLMLFTAPHIARIIAAYDEAAPLADGWQERVGLHQLFPVMVHAIVFGGGYVAQAAEMARTYA